jgi:hypothetical protein
MLDHPPFQIIGNPGVKIPRPASQSVDAVTAAHNQPQKKQIPHRRSPKSGDRVRDDTNPKNQAKQE